MKEEILRLENVTKKINDLILLDGFYLHIFKGEVMGLLSLNTTGKNVFSEILCHHSPIDFGRIYLNDHLTDTDELNKTNRNKVFNIEGQTSLSLNLTVADNIFVIRNGFKKYAINNRILFGQAKMLFKEFDIHINPKGIVANLTPLECITVEFIKAYASGAKLIILSNLTNYLGTLDLEKLNKIVTYFKEKGISFLCIDSYLDILFKFSDRLTIMRDGKNIRTLRKSEFVEKKVISLFADRFIEPGYERVYKKTGQVVLEFKNVITDYLDHINFKIYKGEIINILDAQGKSNEDIIQILNADSQSYSGEVIFDGKLYKSHHLSEVIKKGVGFLIENSIDNLLFKDMSVYENLTFMMTNKISRLWQKPRIKKSIIQEFYKRLGDAIFANDLIELDTAALLKLVYYKWFLYSPKVLVCIRPFIGLDMFMRKLAIDLINELSAKGITTIILTSNLSEAYIACDRMLLIEKGRLIGEYRKGNIKQEEINIILENMNHDES